MAVVKRGAEFLAEGERLVDCCDTELRCPAGQRGTRGLQRTLRVAVRLDDGHEFRHPCDGLDGLHIVGDRVEINGMGQDGWCRGSHSRILPLLPSLVNHAVASRMDSAMSWALQGAGPNSVCAAKNAARA